MDEFDYMQDPPMLAAGEHILWKGKPRRNAFVASRSLTLLPIAVIWLCFDIPIMAGFFRGGGMWFLLPFFAFHLMPVWVWLGMTVTAGRRWKNTAYYITNRRVIIQSGVLAVNETSLYHKDIRNAQVRIDLLDKLFHTGDVILDNGIYPVRRNRTQKPVLEDLEDPRGVYNRIQKIILDGQTEISGCNPDPYV